jgi:hypothetical protein
MKKVYIGANCNDEGAGKVETPALVAELVSSTSLIDSRRGLLELSSCMSNFSNAARQIRDGFHPFRA